ELPLMSSHTSGASLRRRCLTLSSDHENIIAAHGPFIESINVSKWEAHNHQPAEPPIRVKVFADLGSYVDTVLPLGSTGHIVAVSNILQDKPNEEYKVYATLVPADYLVTGGYALRNRFVISTQPLSEKPCQPKVAVVSQSSKLLVLTGSCLKIFEYSFNADDATTAFVLPEIHTVNFRVEWPSHYTTGNHMTPLFISPTELFEFALLRDEKTVVIANYKKGENKSVYKVEAQIHNTTTPISVLHLIHDMKVLLMADHRELHVVPTAISVKEGEVRGDRIIKEIAAVSTDEPTTHISVTEGGLTRMVATVESARVRLWTLTPTSFNAYGSIDCRSTPVTRCLIFHRSTKNTDDASSKIERKMDPLCLLSDEDKWMSVTQEVREEAVRLFKGIIAAHNCTAVVKDGAVATPCVFGDCKNITKKIEHIVKCTLKEQCPEKFCVDFTSTLSVGSKGAAEIMDKHDAGASARLMSLLATIPEASGMMLEAEQKGTVSPSETRTLLAIAFESGDMKLLDTAAYRTPSQQLLPMLPGDIFSADIVAFCPVWKPWTKEGGGEMSNLKGIFAVTTLGFHVLWPFGGPDNNPAKTTPIAKEVIDQSSFVDPETGATMIVAYGRKAVHVSVDFPQEEIREPTISLSTTSFISECFAQLSHFVVCADKRIVLVSFVTFAPYNNGVTRGVGADLLELDGIHNISAYGAIHGCGQEKTDLQLSIVGTSNGRIYSMKMLEKGELVKDGHGSLQALIDAPATKQFIYQESLSTPFISSDNERIVSTVTRWIDGIQEMIVMGIKGSIVRFSYGRGKGLTVVEMITASLVSPSSSPSPLTYRNLTAISGENESPLIVAYKIGNFDAGVRSMEIHLLDYETKESLFSVDVERNNDANLHRSDHVFVYGSTAGKGGGASLITLSKGETGKGQKKATKDSFVRFEGNLLMTERNQLVQAAAFPNSLQAVHMTSFIHDDGKRSASVIGVHSSDVIEATMSPSGKLRPRAKIELSDEEKKYEHSCSDLISTPDCSFLLIGCKGGEVLLVRMERPGDPIDSLDFIDLIKEPAKIEKLSIFSESQRSIKCNGQFLFAVMTKEAVRVYSMSLAENDLSIELLRTWRISMSVSPMEYTLIGLGSRHFSPSLWLTNRREIIMWTGNDGTFNEEMARIPFDVEDTVSAVVPFTVKWSQEEGASKHAFGGRAWLTHMLCVGTASGRLQGLFSVSPQEMKAFDMPAVGAAVRSLACQVFESMDYVDLSNLQFGVRVYILTDRRVVVNTMRVNVNTNGMTIKQIATHNLHHLVRHPTLISIEKSVDRGVTEKTKKKELPQRIIVTGGEGYEVLLLCPKKMQFKENALTVNPVVCTISAVGEESNHVMKNNTDRVMHVSMKRTATDSAFSVSESEWKLEKKSQLTMRIVRNGREMKEGDKTTEKFVMEWKVEKDEKNEEEKGEVILYVKTK
ncbi:hypothetical protein PFISCL1PPCAC_20893, partial [Pristionchus fissidentatus]